MPTPPCWHRSSTMSSVELNINELNKRIDHLNGEINHLAGKIDILREQKNRFNLQIQYCRYTTGEEFAVRQIRDGFSQLDKSLMSKLDELTCEVKTLKNHQWQLPKKIAVAKARRSMPRN